MSRKVRFDDDPCAPFSILFKVLVIGDSAVGKSSLVKRFADDHFETSFISTIGVDYEVRTFEHAESGKKIKLQLWDTAGQERFRAITKAYYRGAHGVMVVYDRTDAESIANVEDVWLHEIDKYGRENVRMLVVGNKDDLAARAESDAEARLLERLDALGIPHTTASAKSGSKVDDSFLAMVEEMLAQRGDELLADTDATPGVGPGRTLDGSKVEGLSDKCCIIM